MTMLAKDFRVLAKWCADLHKSHLWRCADGVTFSLVERLSAEFPNFDPAKFNAFVKRERDHAKEV